MKRKGILAFLAALALCTATACGEIEELTPAAAAVIDSSETIAAENNSIAETPTEKTKEEAPVSDNKLLINDDNCIIINDSDFTFDKETLYQMTELAAEQYNAVIGSDKQSYFDTVNIPGLLKSEGMINAFCDNFYHYDDPEQGFYFLAFLACDESVFEDKKDFFENKPDDTNDEAYKSKLRDTLSDAAEKLTIENTSTLFEDDSSAFARFIKMKEKYGGENIEGLRLSAEDGAVYTVDIEDYSSSDLGTFAELYINIYKNDKKFVLDRCTAGIYDSGSSAYISNIYFKNAEHENMSVEEIRRDSEDLSRLDEMNAAAKVAFNAAAEYITDCECCGISMNEVFENGSFKQADSETGLLLGDNSVGADGDKALAKALKSCEFTDGFVFVGRTEINGEDTFFVQYRAQEGGYIGQYPSRITAERAERAEWGTYLP